MGTTARHRALAGLAAALLLSLTACGGASPVATAPIKNTLPAAAEPSEAPVTVTGLPDGTEAEVTGTTAGISPGRSLTFVSPVYELSPSGDLGARATVTMELDNALPAATPVVVATRETPADSWTFVSARLTSDHHHVAFSTDHFSLFGALAVDTGEIYAGFKDDVRAALAAQAVAGTVAHPACAQTAEARQDEYSVSAWKRKTLSWCFGLQDGKRVLTVVNRRHVPVLVTHGDAPALDTTDRVRGVWSTWARALPADSEGTFLAPGGSATYDADLEPDTELLVSAGSDPVVQSVRVLQASVRAVALAIDSFGVAHAEPTSVLRALLARRQCTRTLGQGGDALLAGCLSTRKLSASFGSDARLLRPLTSARGLKGFLAKQLASLEREDTEVLAHHVLVHRAKPDFGDLVATWTGPLRTLSVDDDGVVTERFSDVTGRVVDLTYQLSEPVSAHGTTTASSVITAVKVHNRKALAGTPPRVGAEGTIILEHGVVRPPYLGTNYCDAHAYKKGTCGKLQPTQPDPSVPGTKKH